MNKKYKKVLIFKCDMSGVRLENEVENVDSILDGLNDDNLEYYRGFISNINKKYSIEEVKELIDSGEELSEREEVDEGGDEVSIWLGVKVDDFDVNKWFRDNWFGYDDVEDVY